MKWRSAYEHYGPTSDLDARVGGSWHRLGHAGATERPASCCPQTTRFHAPPPLADPIGGDRGRCFRPLPSAPRTHRLDPRTTLGPFHHRRVLARRLAPARIPLHSRQRPPAWNRPQVTARVVSLASLPQRSWGRSRDPVPDQQSTQRARTTKRCPAAAKLGCRAVAARPGHDGPMAACVFQGDALLFSPGPPLVTGRPATRLVRRGTRSAVMGSPGLGGRSVSIFHEQKVVVRPLFSLNRRSRARKTLLAKIHPDLCQILLEVPDTLLTIFHVHRSVMCPCERRDEKAQPEIILGPIRCRHQEDAPWCRGPTVPIAQSAFVVL